MSVSSQARYSLVGWQLIMIQDGLLKCTSETLTDIELIFSEQHCGQNRLRQLILLHMIVSGRKKEEQQSGTKLEKVWKSRDITWDHLAWGHMTIIGW